MSVMLDSIERVMRLSEAGRFRDARQILDGMIDGEDDELACALKAVRQAMAELEQCFRTLYGYDQHRQVIIKRQRVALERIAEGAPTEEPERYDGDNHGDTAMNAAEMEHWRLAKIAREGLGK